MSPPSRRRALQACGLAIASTAGCLDRLRTSDDPPTLAMGESYETDDGRIVTLSDPAVHRSVVSVEYVSSTHYYERVAHASDGQYLAFDVAVDGFDLGTPGREQYAGPINMPLAVAMAGDRYSDPIPVGRDEAPATDRVAIRVPVAPAADAAIRWAREDGPEPRWQLEPPVRSHLGAAPAFELRSWSVPDRVEHGASFEASITVANVGDRDGRFLTTLGVKEGSLGVPETAVQVPADDTRTHTATITPEVEGAETHRVVLDWGADRRTATVEVRT